MEKMRHASNHPAGTVHLDQQGFLSDAGTSADQLYSNSCYILAVPLDVMSRHAKQNQSPVFTLIGSEKLHGHS